MIRALLLSLALFCGSPSFAFAAYTSLFSIGDSLSDGGNAYEMTGFWPPFPPYAQRFSNGPVTVEHLADLLGVPTAPSALGGTNYAVGGATTGTRNYSFEIGDPAGLPPALGTTGMLNQVSAFLASGTTFDPSRSLFTVWGGPNDFFLAVALGEDLASTVANAVTNIATVVGLLASAGATDIVVPNMGDLAQTPFGLAQSAEVQAALSAVSTGFNNALALALAALEADLGLDLITIDVAGLFDEVLANPAAYGFTDVTTPCLATADPTTVPDCAGIFFFDEVHPTTAAHRLVAQAIFAEIAQAPEPGILALLAVALFAAVIGRRGASRRGVRAY